MKNCDILNLEWNGKGRDVDIVEPVLSYLELKYGLRIVRECIANFEYKFLKYKPTMLVISNGGGARVNVDAVKYAVKRGIKVVTLISEGDYKEDVENFFWKWNKEHIFYEDLHLEWSQRNIALIHAHIPGSENYNIKVSGATGFDRYKILPFMQKEAFLTKYNKENYKKIIGIAGWGFDLLYQDSSCGPAKPCTKDEINFHKESKKCLRDIYKKLIEHNKDILFILKYHPAILQKELTEFHKLDMHENIILFGAREESIDNLINVSDIWIAYESTTCLEAWLLKKPTMLVNPLGGKFKRSILFRGSPVKISKEETQLAIDNFYKRKELSGFKELESNRRLLINQIIERDDGKNHLRAGDYIYKEFQSNEKIRKPFTISILERYFKSYVTAFLIASGLANHGPWVKNKKLQDLLWLAEKYNPMERRQEHQKYLQSLKEFYERNNIALTK